MPKHLQNNALQEKNFTIIKTICKEKKVTREIFYFDIGTHHTRVKLTKKYITVATYNILCNYLKISLGNFFKQDES